MTNNKIQNLEFFKITLFLNPDITFSHNLKILKKLAEKNIGYVALPGKIQFKTSCSKEKIKAYIGEIVYSFLKDSPKFEISNWTKRTIRSLNWRERNGILI